MTPPPHSPPAAQSARGGTSWLRAMLPSRLRAMLWETAIWLGARSLTGNARLADEARRFCQTHPNPKEALRRIAWYARRRGAPAPAPRDLMHVFCEEMAGEDLVAMRAFLDKHRAKASAGLLLSEYTLLSAQALLTTLLAAPRCPVAATAQARATFGADVDAFLAQLHQGIAPDYGQAPAAPRFPLDKDEAARALAAATQALRGANHRPFILSGTLLGAVREGDFLPHDYDIDLGLLIPDPQQAAPLIESLSALFAAHPEFTLLKTQSQIRFTTDRDTDANADGTLNATQIPVVLKIAHANGIPIDVFLHYREGDLIWHGTDIYRWDNAAFTLVPYTMHGVSVEGPQDADLFLTENYGDWRTPKPAFQCALDTPNQSLVPNPMSLALFLRRAWLELARDRRSTDGLLAQLAAAGYLVGNPQTGYRLAKTAFSDRPAPPEAA